MSCGSCSNSFFAFVDQILHLVVLFVICLFY